MSKSITLVSSCASGDTEQDKAGKKLCSLTQWERRQLHVSPCLKPCICGLDFEGERTHYDICTCGCFAVLHITESHLISLVLVCCASYSGMQIILI